MEIKRTLRMRSRFSVIQEVFGGMRKGIKEILKGEEGRGALRTMMVLMLNRGWDGVVGCLYTINCIHTTFFYMGLKQSLGLYLRRLTCTSGIKETIFEIIAALIMIDKGFSFTGN